MGKVWRTAALSAVVLMLSTGTGAAAAGDISLVAGGGGPGHGGDGGSAVAAQLTFPEDCESGPDGVIYVAEDQRIRRIDADGVITTFAPETEVWPAALAVADTGTVYVADFNPTRPRVLAITSGGTVHRLAGTDEGPGYSGDGGPATDARIGQPLSLALTTDAVYFTDGQTGAVRRVDLATGTIDAVPQFAGSYDLAAGPDGVVYAASLETHSIVAMGTNGQVRPIAGTGSAGYSGDGGPATSAALDRPLALAVDSAGTVFISDAGNHRIRRVGTDGIITTSAGTGVEGVSGDGGPAVAATLVTPRGLGIDAAGALCIADTGGGVVRAIEGAAAPTPPVAATLPATGARLGVLGAAAAALVAGSMLLVASRRYGRPGA